MPHTIPHERIEVLSTRFRMSIPNRFHRDPGASELATCVARILDATDVVVQDATDGTWLYFTLPDTRSDVANAHAIRNAIEDIVDTI